MNIEAEAYRQAFGFPTVSPAQYQHVLEIKAQDVAEKWVAIQNRRAVPAWWQWILLLFVGWTWRVRAPLDAKDEAYVTDMAGFPLFRYKEMGGKIYLLRPEPSPGFPGS